MSLKDVDSPMPFGKYKTFKISDLPSSYLRWVLENVENNPILIEIVEKEVEYRDRHDLHHEDSP